MSKLVFVPTALATKKENESFNGSGRDIGRPLDAGTARELSDKFRQKDYMKVKVKDPKNPTQLITMTLNGIKIPLVEIETIIDQVRRNQRTPEGIFVQPIESPDDPDASTFMISGYDTNNCLHTNTYREYFDPCPNDCPELSCTIPYNDQ